MDEAFFIYPNGTIGQWGILHLARLFLQRSICVRNRYKKGSIYHGSKIRLQNTRKLHTNKSVSQSDEFASMKSVTELY